MTHNTQTDQDLSKVDTVLTILLSRANTVDEFVLWRELVGVMDENSLTELHDHLQKEIAMVEQWRQQELNEYLNSHMDAGNEMVNLMAKWAESDGDLQEKTMQLAAFYGERANGLSPEDLATVLSSPEAFTAFVEACSLKELEIFKQQLSSLPTDDTFTETFKAELLAVLHEVELQAFQEEKQRLADLHEDNDGQSDFALLAVIADRYQKLGHIQQALIS